MNLTPLFEKQRALDAHILETHPELQGVDLLAKKIMALQVELGELANELPEVFKFWSNKKNNMERALAEYVDALHFILSIALEYGVNANDIEIDPEPFGDVISAFLATQHIFSIPNSSEMALKWYQTDIGLGIDHFLGLGKVLGFSWEQIEQAYMEKNAENHKRQEVGY